MDMKENQTTATRAQYFNADEAASYLELTRSYLYKLVFRKEIPYFKYGRKLRFRCDQLEAWKQARFVAIPSFEETQQRAANYCLNH